MKVELVLSLAKPPANIAMFKIPLKWQLYVTKLMHYLNVFTP